MWHHGFKWASGCARTISIRRDIHDCHDMRAEGTERFTRTMVSSCFRIQMRCLPARIRSTFIPYDSWQGSCGVPRLLRRIRCTSICGTTTLSRLDAVSGSDKLAALPRLPRDEGGPVFAEPWQAQAFALAVKLSE